jgi:hypothetical protein
LPPGFNVIYLPFADGIRKINTLKDNLTARPNQEMINISKKLVKKLYIKDFSSTNIENPAIQQHYASLQALALEHDNLEKVIDYTEPDNEGMEKYKKVFETWNEEMNVKNIKKEVKDEEDDEDNKDNKNNKKRKLKDDEDDKKKNKKAKTEKKIKIEKFDDDDEIDEKDDNENKPRVKKEKVKKEEENEEDVVEIDMIEEAKSGHVIILFNT